MKTLKTFKHTLVWIGTVSCGVGKEFVGIYYMFDFTIKISGLFKGVRSVFDR